ncbi:GAP family protein [Myceligenerans xiligouense]|uniref:Sap-like sulfolipid-1-addressing protein n=1 Tax=Myceligenerans xiligouense TaxID=253184 RepID=A0A3N4ZB70_9MICO|nr:GAP family protein [Myceligenerans xiligouense]RPF22692.1 Sap-like sulfolipid-1-addressing protein [Myceligenerans xiligouense]
MEGLTPAGPLLAVLVGLALVDSTSVGTLGLPVFLLAQPRIRASAVLTYLGAIALFYWVLGVALHAGAGSALRVLEGAGSSRTLDQAQLVLGVGLFLASFLFDGPIGRWRRERRERAGKVSAMQRWKTRLVGPDASAGTVVATALAAGVVEAASMLPYLAAIGILTANGIGVVAGALILVAYCLVMVAPALLLLALRVGAARAIEPMLGRINDWFSRRSGDLLAWTLGIVGFLLAADAFGRLQ